MINKLDPNAVFRGHLPDNLYLSHYELNRKYPQIPPAMWRKYLKDNEQFITSETAMIAEANARQALQKLGDSKNPTTAQEVAAIKALLEKSKLINDAQKQQQHVMLTYMPRKEYEHED